MQSYTLYLQTPQRKNRSKSKNTFSTSVQFRRFLVATATMRATMEQQGREEKQAKRRQTMDHLCSASGLLLSVLCCTALIHVELRIQEHHRLISHSGTSCDNMEREILRKAQEDDGKWRVMATSRHWQAAKGRFRYVNGTRSFLPRNA